LNIFLSLCVVVSLGLAQGITVGNCFLWLICAGGLFAIFLCCIIFVFFGWMYLYAILEFVDFSCLYRLEGCYDL